MTTAVHPSTEEVWAWLADVEDPEIPVLSVVDLGIVRDVRWVDGDEPGAEPECVVTVTPTYSGCPATDVISQSIRDALRAHGVARSRLQIQISPAWTTDWLSDEAKRKLRDYGIAPPTHQFIPISAIGRGPRSTAPPPPVRVVACPLCGSEHTELTSQFGSTPCKALYRCLDCHEPFDLFKCH